MAKSLHVALVGNPNTGKTSVFNRLTGLNQKVGNYPGITVDRQEGYFRLADGSKVHVLDLPGTYSLNATSADEQIVVKTLLDSEADNFPDVAVMVADVENLKRNLLLFTQIKDLNIPVILAINMADLMERKGISLNTGLLEKHLQTKVALISARKGTGISHLKELIAGYQDLPTNTSVDISKIDPEYFEKLAGLFPGENQYKVWLKITQDLDFPDEQKKFLSNTQILPAISQSEVKRLQQKATILRYLFINKILKETFVQDIHSARDFRSRLDRVLTHRIYGYLSFFLIMLLVFQSIYNWSEYPMDFIDNLFASIAHWVHDKLPAGTLSSLISEGIIPGIGGVVIFIPQIYNPQIK